jgi:hypothetical protein
VKGTAVVLFSGGSDCTLAAAKAARGGRFEEIILLTYEVPVSCLDENAGRNVPRLREAFPDVRFTHVMMPAGPSTRSDGKARSVPARPEGGLALLAAGWGCVRRSCTARQRHRHVLDKPRHHGPWVVQTARG